MSKAL